MFQWYHQWEGWVSRLAWLDATIVLAKMMVDMIDIVSVCLSKKYVSQSPNGLGQDPNNKKSLCLCLYLCPCLCVCLSLYSVQCTCVCARACECAFNCAFACTYVLRWVCASACKVCSLHVCVPQPIKCAVYMCVCASAYKVCSVHVCVCLSL